MLAVIQMYMELFQISIPGEWRILKKRIRQCAHVTVYFFKTACLFDEALFAVNQHHLVTVMLVEALTGSPSAVMPCTCTRY